MDIIDLEFNKLEGYNLEVKVAAEDDMMFKGRGVCFINFRSTKFVKVNLIRLLSESGWFFWNSYS